MHTWDSIGFMKSCLGDMAGMDVNEGYRWLFEGIRGLAGVLRRAVTTNTKVEF